jgi:hypothetical protein
VELDALAAADEVSTLQELDPGGDGPAPSSAKASDAVSERPRDRLGQDHVS